MLMKPYAGQFRATLEFGDKYGDYLGLKGKTHLGLDLALPTGTEIVSPGDGQIEEVGTDDKDYGNFVKIKINNLWVYLSHMDQIDVTMGQSVSRGQRIGTSGKSGRVTGPHLDIRVHDLEKWNEPYRDYQNPREYIDFEAPEPEKSPEQEPNPAPQPPQEYRTYTVQPGDSLWKIAKRELGDARRFPEIFQLNRDQIENQDLIYPDQVLKLPN